MRNAALAAALCALALCRAPARAQSWTAADPAGALDDDNPSSTADLAFNDQLQNRGFHQVCDKIPAEIPYSNNEGLLQSQEDGKSGTMFGGAASLTRGFYRDPTGGLALIDKVSFDAMPGYGRRVIRQGKASGLALFLSAEFKGQSIVVRPLDKTDSCQELGRLLKVSEFKLAFPLTAKRISAMKVGELWKIPASFQIGVGPRPGLYPKGPSLAGAFWLSLTYSRSRDGMATLYRMAPNAVRLRVRVDRVQAFTIAGETIDSPLPLIDLGKPRAEKFFGKILTKMGGTFAADGLADALNSYLAAVFDVSIARYDGEQAVLEYVLDPSNPAQMEGLERALRGDLAAISPLAVGKDLVPFGRDARVRSFLAGLVDANDQATGASADFAAADASKSRIRHLHLRVPIILSYDHTRSRSSDRIVFFDRSQGELRGQTASRASSRGFFDFPLLDGNLKRSQGQRAVQAAQFVAADGSASDPVVVYVQQEGFLRGGPDRASAMIAKTAGLMSSLAGAGAPPVAPPPPAKGSYTGQASLTIVLGRQALEDLSSATPAQVVAAFARSLDGLSARIMSVLVDKGFVAEDGTIADPAAPFSASQAEALLAQELAAKAEGLVRDVAAIRAAKTPEQLSAAVVKLVSGGGAGGLAYEAAMKVVLALCKPQHVSAEFLSTVDGKGLEASPQRWLFNAAGFQDADVRRLSRVNRRFMAPLPLSD